MENWNGISAVTVCFRSGKKIEYSSLEEAVSHSTYAEIETESKDQHDLIIPAWKIKEVSDKVPRIYRSWKRFANRKFKFRDGPVPYVRSKRGGRAGGVHKGKLKQQLVSSYQYLDDMEESEGYLKPCTRNVRPFFFWNDYYEEAGLRNNNWKRFRKQQYKN